MKKFHITKKEKKRYRIIFVVSVILVLVAMTIDNISWISASPEWNTPHTVLNEIREWTGPVSEYTLGQLINYVFGYRIYEVWTNWRDIISALIVGIIITGIVIFSNEILGKRVFSRSFLK